MATGQTGDKTTTLLRAKVIPLISRDIHEIYQKGGIHIRMEKVTKCVTRDNEVVARYCFVGHYEHWTPLCLVISHENQRGDLNQNHERRKHLTSHSPIIWSNLYINSGGRKAKVIKFLKRVNDVKI
ncbi:hypothetical protein HanIR_Chr15g0743341 [Helianthus annuus]|nr:hypothetical protein HanIR_Chr15g0743341 [Helianthus annuus]